MNPVNTLTPLLLWIHYNAILVKAKKETSGYLMVNNTTQIQTPSSIDSRKSIKMRDFCHFPSFSSENYKPFGAVTRGPCAWNL